LEKPGICEAGVNYDVSAFVPDYDAAFFSNGGLAGLQEIINTKKNHLPVLDAGTRLGAPVALPSKIICIGLNYADHAKETNIPKPTEPVIFLKATSAIIGPFDDVVIPLDSEKTDWEVELAVVIEKKASYVSVADAMNHVAGYCVHNDISERSFQLERGGTWDKGKGCDTFAPLGPWLVTKEEIADVNNIKLWLHVNGKQMQNGNTSNLIFDIPFLSSYVSRFMTLLPGDIISTGTPAGVGLGFNPPVYLKPGDVMELGIDGLGVSKQKCVAYGS
jgi:2-keto-4-pentenoate hydratase/2-oxohepta-3-ene-1,7-dioic acid hydratase in catechol pathway